MGPRRGSSVALLYDPGRAARNRERQRAVWAVLAALLIRAPARAELFPINPTVKKIVDAISADRIAANIRKLQSFGTRHTLSDQNDPNRGIGAARRWIEAELRRYSPRLQVRLDTHRVARQGRITRDVELSNVVAELPGTVDKQRRIIIAAHYDTVALRAWRSSDEAAIPGLRVREADPNAPAPGANDDGSGTAAVMEIARVMSRFEFEKTVEFVLFAGEEQGLIGSRLYAEQARKAKRQIEAVLNNDIIGSIESGDGRIDNTTVRIFSAGPEDSGSRQLARYIKDVGERYVPSMQADVIFRADRFGRGGDHMPFEQEGYSAVRFSSAEENYSHQHTATDTIENMSPAYTARVARINAAALASLALAPKPPVVTAPPPVILVGLIPFVSGPGAPRILLSSGKSRYDALLRWRNEKPEPDLAGYIVLIRRTTAPFWERRIFVGNVTEFLMPGMSINEVVFGVQAVDRDGNASLVSAYTLPEYPRVRSEDR